MPEPTALDEVHLIRRIAARDQNALSELYNAYGGMVYGLTYRILQNSTFAEEVTQDIFLTIWNQASRWDSARGTLIAWMLSIARNAAIDRLRQEQRRPLRTAVDLDDMLEMIGVTGTVDDPVWHDGRLLRTLMERLPAEQADAIRLAFFEGLSHTEISDRLRLPLGTVKTRVRLGMQKLKDLWIEAGGRPEQR
jgi:RNA polymerase sigma-70 factor (ECF subfamily)